MPSILNHESFESQIRRFVDVVDHKTKPYIPLPEILPKNYHLNIDDILEVTITNIALPYIPIGCISEEEQRRIGNDVERLSYKKHTLDLNVMDKELIGIYNKDATNKQLIGIFRDLTLSARYDYKIRFAIDELRTGRKILENI